MAASFSLPLPPSVNALYRNVPGRGRVKTHRYQTWLNAAGWALKEARPAPMRGDYAMMLICQRPDRRRRDLGNLLKAIEDVLTAHGIIEDDSLATEIHMSWAGGQGNGCVVRLEKVND
jgi:crossover junction endodeoxyribonuclease RusA